LFIGFVEKFGYRNSDLIVGTMPNLQEHVNNIGFSNKPVFCSPLGFDPENYSERDLSINNPFININTGDKILIGYAGSMGLTNGLDIFIETIKSMNSCSNIHFLIVGSGDLKEKYQAELAHYENVTFLPRIEQKQVKYFLDSCDILYLSTQNSKVWKYGQSMNKIVEYMLAAKPIIATYNGYPSMINEADCGIFVNSSNSLELRTVFLKYASFSKVELKKIGEKGRKWICENRTYSKLAKEYLDKISLLMD
jgi:glycosyltransferase involved in cell wall biosynthesis